MKLPNNGASSIGEENPMPMDDASLAPEGGNKEEPMPMGDEEMPMNDMPMDSDIPEGDNGMGDDETMNIINKLSPKDKEAVKSYAESLSSNNEDSNEPEQQEPMQDGLNMEAPMNETFIFKKSQLNKLMENFGPTNDELVKDKKANLSKKNKKVAKNSPFNAPDFE